MMFTKKTIYAATLVLAGLFLSTYAEFVGTYSFRADETTPSDFKSAWFDCWLPDNHENITIRGMISVVKYQADKNLWELSAGNNEHIYVGLADSIKKIAAEHDFGVIVEQVHNTSKDGSVLYKGPYQITALERAFSYYATKTEHPELEYAAIIFMGLSQSGGTAFVKSSRVPDRTVTTIPWHSATRGDEMSAAYNVPMLVPIGSKDGTIAANRAYPEAHPQNGAIWTPYLQANVEHQKLENNNDDFGIYFEWLRWIINVRVPAQVSGTGPVQLNPVNIENGYFISGTISNEKPFEWDNLHVYPATGAKPQNYMGWVPAEMFDTWKARSLPAVAGEFREMGELETSIEALRPERAMNNSIATGLTQNSIVHTLNGRAMPFVNAHVQNSAKLLTVSKSVKMINQFKGQ